MVHTAILLPSPYWRRRLHVLAFPLYRQANGNGKGTNIEKGKVEFTDIPVDVRMELIWILRWLK